MNIYKYITVCIYIAIFKRQGYTDLYWWCQNMTGASLKHQVTVLYRLWTSDHPVCVVWLHGGDDSIISWWTTVTAMRGHKVLERVTGFVLRQSGNTATHREQSVSTHEFNLINQTPQPADWEQHDYPTGYDVLVAYWHRILPPVTGYRTRLWGYGLRGHGRGQITSCCSNNKFYVAATAATTWMFSEEQRFENHLPDTL